METVRGSAVTRKSHYLRATRQKRRRLIMSRGGYADSRPCETPLCLLCILCRWRLCRPFEEGPNSANRCSSNIYFAST